MNQHKRADRPQIQLPSKAQTASFDVDAQYTFTPVCPDELPVAGGDEIAHELNAQAKFADYRLGSKDAHSLKAQWLATPSAPVFSPIAGKNMDIRWPAHAVVGTRGFELLDTLPKPSEYDYFVWKGVELDMHPYGACFHDLQDRLSTGAIEFLRASGVTTVLVGGLATDYCVCTTALQLRRAGFEVVVNLGACRGITPETCAQAEEKLLASGVVLIQSAAELLALEP
jgi:nicotinamidase/pyrazinamidase